MHTEQRGSRIRSCTHAERLRPTTKKAPSLHWYHIGVTNGQPSGFSTASLSSHVLSELPRKTSRSWGVIPCA